MESIYLGGFAAVVIIVIGIVFAKLYVRAPKDLAFVRTGLGGQRVIQDGGALKLPVLHDITWVNLRTLRLEVNRQREAAMITLDRMRVDIGVEFYVRVKPNRESIALAAQTLGERTLDGEQLRDLVEAKFVDALRGVAAQMNLNDLHEKRTDFVQKVQNSVSGDLEQNGLELESVSLTTLDQTSSEFFNPNNAFDAEGLTRLTEITQHKKKERNEIEQETRIAIEQRNLQADQRAYEISQEKDYARLNTERNVANYAAETRAQTAQKEAEAKRLEEEAAIQTRLAVERKQIESDRDVELTRQDKAITVATKSQEESLAAAEANKARATAVREEEQVKTVARVAEAERQKAVAIVAAREQAEKNAVGVTVAAEAERAASEDEAEATLITARANSEATKIAAEADAARYQVEAEGQEAINAARNVLDDRIIALELKKALIEVMPEVMAASMKAVEKIKDIRVIDFGQGMAGGAGLMPNIAGTNGGGNGAQAGGNLGGGGSLPDNIVQSLLNYRMQAPLVDELLTDLGFNAKENPNTMLHRLSQSIGNGQAQPEDAGDAPKAKGGKRKPPVASATPPATPDGEGTA
ncbi:flotillin family protein [Pelagibius marinus]|uniref:flotillin family protein n=1 Tax=Pelagibius marinus TaxID=2762760 RepID=UPI0018724AA4|nr:flotillin domain-containing protein [Pelagibius marinus]